MDMAAIQSLRLSPCSMFYRTLSQDQKTGPIPGTGQPELPLQASCVLPAGHLRTWDHIDRSLLQGTLDHGRGHLPSFAIGARSEHHPPPDHWMEALPLTRDVWPLSEKYFGIDS